MFQIKTEDVKTVMAGDMIAEALRNYKFVTETLFVQDISADYTYQKAYCDLYGVDNSYSEEFRSKFFVALEEMKKISGISFRDAFEKLMAIGGKYEMTAASILVHTINPRFAIWDDKAAKDFFGMDTPKAGDSVERCCKLYEDFSDKFYQYTNSVEGAILVKAFNERFPNAEVPDVVKVGFLLWQLESMQR
jgi:hypothetical protein